MKKITVYPCNGHSDTTEGRGPMFEVCYASSKNVADEIMKHPSFFGAYGVMGCDNCGVSRAKNMIVYDSLEEYLDDISEKSIRARALEKLTTEEKRVLGL